VTSSAEPRELLALAGALLGRADPQTRGLWPRAAAILALQALGASLERVWDRSDLAFRGCPMATQLICLRTYLDDSRLATRAAHAAAALHRSCHHHPYELAPTVSELQAWLSVVGELVASVEGPPEAGDRGPA